MLRQICLLIITFCYCLLSHSQEKIVPLFLCEKKLKSPYGVTANFTLKWDYSTQIEQINLIKAANIDNIRYDFWVPYPQELHGNKLLPVIEQSVSNSLNAQMNILAILFVGYRGQRAWQMPEKYWEQLEYFIDKYANKVKYWEVLNEVNLTADRDTVPIDSVAAQYMSLLPLTYKKIKRKNSNCIVTSSGLGDLNDDFLELLCEKRAFESFDVLNFHSYDLPERFPDKFMKIKALMDKYNWKKPVWISECGMTTYVNPETATSTISLNTKEEEQAYRIARMHIVSFAYGVEKVYTFKFKAKETNENDPEDYYGIIHADLTPKPAYLAYKTMTRMLPSGSARPTLIIDGYNYYSFWKRRDGKKVFAIWNTKGETSIQLRIRGKAEAYNYLGQSIELQKSGQVRIGKGVVFIVGNKKLTVDVM